MDRDTELIWANLNYFPYRKGKRDYLDYYSTETDEVVNLISEINLNEFGGFNSWQIPYASDLWDLVEDKSFPFITSTKYVRMVMYENLFCVRFNKNGELVIGVKDITQEGWDKCLFTDVTFTCIIPQAYLKHSTYELTSSYDIRLSYKGIISPDNNTYTEKQKLHFTLDIFIRNNLTPIFNEHQITELYKIIFVEKQNYKLIFFDELVFEGYDITAVNKSVIKYYEAVLSLTDEMLNVLKEYETAQAETIAEFLKIALKLGAKYTDNPNLTAEENKMLAERQKILAARLELGTDEVNRKIISVKNQAERFFKRLDEINSGENSISELGKIAAEPRANFELLVENLAKIIRDAQKKVDFFTENKNLVVNVINLWSAWSDDYKAFKTSLSEELTAICRENDIDEEIFAVWYEDWRVKRYAIEQRFMPLVEYGLKGNFSDAIEEILKILQSYKESVDKFYLHERKNIYQKFAFIPGGDLQEKFETESELYKLAENLQRELQKIIFSRDKTEERIYLLRWSEPILNLPIEEISKFIAEKELDAISEEVLTQFTALKRRNFATYLSDAKAYGEAIQKREKEYNALIFRMRKDLSK